MIDGVLQQLEIVARAIPRTGTRVALVACYPDAPPQPTETAAVIEEFASVLPTLLRDGDLVARDEAGRAFILLTGVQDLPNAVAVVTRIRDSLAEAAPDGPWSSVCYGVTLVSRGEGSQTLVDRAVGALMLAQGAGAGRIVTSPPL